ncbi:Armadillo/beta-Catenin/plakoglobin [Pseudoloma neurophilia]|uniref:Armadillo/beta-Catenin/plakoglobin n=1 Tax=Pseudoloma neurophilia TaxID=146866 RepID=A0A0R0LW00_9MICR|nr:Armadillo/beta-Catenin/plakoglobin [Pseudoloma neurophilia]
MSLSEKSSSTQKKILENKIFQNTTKVSEINFNDEPNEIAQQTIEQTNESSVRDNLDGTEQKNDSEKPFQTFAQDKSPEKNRQTNRTEMKHFLNDCVYSQSESTNIDNKIILSMLRTQFTTKTKVIVIHGPSASGKSTLAKNLQESLSKEHNVLVLSTDSFYKSFAAKNIEDWDFDNPGAIDWENVHETLRAIHNGDEMVPFFKYSFFDHKSTGPFYYKNTKPDIIIIEGILALNLFSDEHLTDFSPIDSSKGKIVKNTRFYPNFSFLKIKLSICREKMRDIKIKRDILERGRTYERALHQFELQVWPATEKWVENTIFKADIHLIHGTFNESGYRMFFSAITEYFLQKPEILILKTSCIETIPCSRNCFLQTVDGLVLWDRSTL